MTARTVRIALAAAAVLVPATAVGQAFRVPRRAVPDGVAPELRKQLLRLQDADPVTRAYAALALEKMGDRAAQGVPFLRDVLPDETPLRHITSYGPSSWTGPTSPGALAGQALWKIRPDEIADVLRRDTAPARYNAVRALLPGARNERNLELLLSAHKDASAKVRETVVFGLASTGGGKAVQAVRQSLADRDAGVRARAVWAVVRKLRDTASAPALLAILARDADAHPRGFAAYYLADLKDARAVGPLIAALGDGSAYVRKHAASSLGLLKDPRAVPALIGLLDDADAQVRQMAASCLRCFDEAQTTAVFARDLNHADWRRRQRAVEAVGRQPDRHLDALLGALRDPSPEVRAEAVEALGWSRTRSAQVAAALAGSLRDAARPAKGTDVMLALERMGNDPAIKAAQDVLAGGAGQQGLDVVAARVLHNMGTPDAREALKAGRQSASPPARQEVERLLARPMRRSRHSRRVARKTTAPAGRMDPGPPRTQRAVETANAHAGRGAPPSPAPAGGGNARFRLSGIIGSAAIINGKVVNAGQTVGGAKVIRVTGRQVELDDGGQRLVLRL